MHAAVSEGFDLIPVSLSDELIDNVAEYINEYSTVGIKESPRIDDNFLGIIADKLTFINAE